MASAVSQQPAGLWSRLVAQAAVVAAFPLAGLFLLHAGVVVTVAATLLLVAAAAIPGIRTRVSATGRALLARSSSFWAACLLGAALVPLVMGTNGYWLFVLSIAMVFAVMAIGINIQLGEIGVINLGYAGLFAIAAYTSALLSLAGWPVWAGALAATFLCWLVGALLGLCSIRTSGDYFALVTLGFGLITHQLIVNLGWLTNGSNGITNISPISLFGHTTKNPIDLPFLSLPPEANGYFLCLLILAGAVLVARRFRNAWVGRMWATVRQDSFGAACFGLNVPMFRLKTIALASAFAGPSGVLFAHLIGFISPDDFTMLQSIEVLAMVILGGMGNIAGVLVGAIILYVAPEKLRFLGDYRLLIYGLMLVVILVYRPKGIIPDPRRIFDRA